MESNYCATYHFFYRIEKEAGWGEDEECIPSAIYTELKIGKATKIMTEESYRELHETHRYSMAETMDIDIKHVIPIGRDEYEENTDSEDE